MVKSETGASSWRGYDAHSARDISYFNHHVVSESRDAVMSPSAQLPSISQLEIGSFKSDALSSPSQTSNISSRMVVSPAQSNVISPRPSVFAMHRQYPAESLMAEDEPDRRAHAQLSSHQISLPPIHEALASRDLSGPPRACRSPETGPPVRPPLEPMSSYSSRTSQSLASINSMSSIQSPAQFSTFSNSTSVTSPGSYFPPYSQYQPSAQHSIPYSPFPSWGSQSAPKPEIHSDEPQPPASVNYSESLKRGLDGIDAVKSLEELNMVNNETARFSNHYAQATRSGPDFGSMPSITEIDHAIQLHHQAIDALVRLRQAAVCNEQAEDRRQTASPDKEKEVVSTTTLYGDDYRASPATSYPAMSESKRRATTGQQRIRRKPAPPGRCHSCNRAETPEWRRGPDGARTLCNACGLHYAKLSRKASVGSASKVSSPPRSSSSTAIATLKPKQSGDGAQLTKPPLPLRHSLA